MAGSNAGDTAEDVARWMVEELNRGQFLYQGEVVYQIAERFGQAFAYENQNGNLAIDKRVHAEFGRLTGELVVWERGERMWRKRADYDEPGKRGQD